MSVSPSVEIHTDIPAADPQLLERLRALDLPTFGHLLDSGFTQGLQCLAAGRQLVAGRVVTVRLVGTDSRILHYSTALVGPGDFVVVEAGANQTLASVGGGIAKSFAAAGVVGIAVDGACTDIVELRESGLNVYGRRLAPVTTRNNGSAIEGSINVPVTIGGVSVQPGMIALGDENGLVFAKPETLEGMAGRVTELLAWEPGAMARVQQGEKLSDIILAPEDLSVLNTLSSRKAVSQ